MRPDVCGNDLGKPKGDPGRNADKGSAEGHEGYEKYPSVLRTEYVYALLAEQNPKKAEKLMAQFRQCAKSYPYPSEIEGERQLMVLAAAKMTAQQEYIRGTKAGK